MNIFGKLKSLFTTPDTHEGNGGKRTKYEPAYLRPRRIKAIVDADKNDILRHRVLLLDYEKWQK